MSSKYPPEYSGSGNRARQTYLRLNDKFGIDFQVMTGSEMYETSHSYLLDDVSVKRVSSIKSYGIEVGHHFKLFKSFKNSLAQRLSYVREFFPAFWFMYKIRNEFDLIHIFGHVTVTDAAVSFAKIFGKPIIVELTSDRKTPWPNEMKCIKWVWGADLPRGTQIICISERLQDMCVRQGITKNIWTRPNPIDVNRFKPLQGQRDKLRLQLTKFNSDDVVILNIGKFNPNKNQIFLLEVLRHLPAAYKLILAGPLSESGPFKRRDQEYFNSIVTRIKEYGLEPRVELKSGFLNNPEYFMNLSDVYAISSLSEGLGTPLIESLACATPVVACAMEGITDKWIVNGRNGYESGRDSQEFSKFVVLASEIGRDSLLRGSESVSDLAAEEKVDEKYALILSQTANIGTEVTSH